MLVAGSVLLAWTSSLAGMGNYQTFAVGERAAGMGGASVALADAVDAAYINPAGLGLAEQSSVSFMATLYGVQKQKLENRISYGEDYKASSFVTVPATMGTVFKLNDGLAVAGSVFIPNQTDISQVESYPTSGNYLNLSVHSKTLWIGPSVGYLATPKLSIGAGVYGLYKTMEHFENFFYGDMHTAYSENFKYSHWGMLGMLGAQYAITEQWKAGLTFQTPSASLYSDGRYQGDLVDGQAGAADYVYSDDITVRNDRPAAVRGGVGYELERKWGVGLDVTYHWSDTFKEMSGVSQRGPHKGEDLFTGNEAVRYDAVTDVNLGGEYYVAAQYPLRAGFYTSKSAVPDTSLERPSDYPSIDLYGITASVGSETDRLAMNFGVNYVWGKGHCIGLAPPNAQHQIPYEVVNASEQQLYVYFTSSYLF
jgi:hypothetical protein